jgi:hypothetical protein
MVIIPHRAQINEAGRKTGSLKSGRRKQRSVEAVSLIVT